MDSTEDGVIQMGKITDAAIALIVLIVGLYVLTKLGITWGGIWKMIHTFFSSPSTSNGTVSSMIFGMAASNSKVRKKMSDRIDSIKRRIISKVLQREEKMAKRRNNLAKE
ncbi:hypothetical protein ACNF42_08320 [Cuniculiplasma sp. SKW3]|uniref:hypothetical protein n=1 Tax=Cuniculiplasma sp. SKW3 TaxID=3400170 RepID=UPI003FD1CDB5